MSVATATSQRVRGLSAGHFRRVAVRGFGDGCNSYAYSCAWFKDHFYVGTNRHMLAIMKTRFDIQVPTKVWPVPLPKSAWDLNLCAQIWRYSPKDDFWDRVYASPMTDGLQGRRVPVASGFRNMGVFQGKSDKEPVLYTIPGCSMYAVGPVLMRCEDGVNFEIASEPGLGLGNSAITAFRGVVPFKDRLYISPAAYRGKSLDCTSFASIIYSSDDPVNGRWEVSNPPEFGDPTNQGIYDLAVCGDYLYAGTVNVREGCQLWKTDAEGPRPYKWTKVFDRGADRGQHNQMISAFADANGVLYCGTAIQNGGKDWVHGIGPAAAEVLRVYPDDSWDLVVGEPRMTRQGLKIPASGMGPGFDNSGCGYVWRMCCHEGAVYAGTFGSATMLPYTTPDEWPDALKRVLDSQTIDQFLKARGGCQLWRSNDGDHWAPITRNGFGNAFNWGIRSLMSTPAGVFVGTVNPFGPQVAVSGPAGWRYEDNPGGGIEIWHGRLEHAGHDDVVSPFDAGMELSALTAESAANADSTSSTQSEWLDYLAPFARGDSQHSPRAAAARQHAGWNDDPYHWLATEDKDLVSLTEDVDAEIADYFHPSPLRHVGYWRNDNVTPGEACRQLIVELLAFLPPPPDDRADSLLIVSDQTAAVGDVVAAVRPKSEISITSSVALPADGTFDAVVWIDGLSAESRSEAFRQTARVLRPGGRFVGVELVGVPLDDDGQFYDALTRDAHLKDETALAREYAAELAATGFVEVQAQDVTRETWLMFFRHSREYFGTKFLFQQLENEHYRRILGALPGGRLVVEACVISSAVKAAPEHAPRIDVTTATDCAGPPSRLESA